MASFSTTTTVTITIIICQTLCLLSSSPAVWGVGREADPKPTPWPHQFHALLWANFSGSLSTIDLWYDWPNGRNLNLVRDQLSDRPLHDVEWNNGTSYFYTLDPSPANQQCRSVHLEVGILRPDWLDGGNYLGQRHVDGFLCNVWEKAEFIWYYEDVVSKSPVHWVFYTGRSIHVMTFEVGAVLEDEKWQAPGYCFENKDSEVDMKSDFATSALDIGFHRNLMRGVLRGSVEL